jgi:hypothetical protein
MPAGAEAHKALRTSSVHASVVTRSYTVTLALAIASDIINYLNKLVVFL